MTDVLITGLATATTLTNSNVVEVQQTGSFTAQVDLAAVGDLALARIGNAVTGSALAGTEKIAGFSGGVKTFTPVQFDEYVKSVEIPRRAPFISGKWYSTIMGGVAISGSANAASVIRLYPVHIHKPVTIASLAVRITTAGTNCQLAIYASDPTTGLPAGSALGTTADMNTASTGMREADLSGGNLTLPGGIYWFASNVNNSLNAFASISGVSTAYTWLIYGNTSASVLAAPATAIITYSLAQTYNTWPNMSGQTLVETNTNSFPNITFKVA